MQRPRLRFSVRAMIVAVAIAAVFTAGLIGFLRSEGWLRRPIELAPPPRWANTDHDLFDIVFSDVNENGESGKAAGGPGLGKSRILVDARTYPVRTDFLEEVLGEQIKNVPAEIRDDLVRRNPRRYGYSLARYQPSNPDVLVDDMGSMPRTVRLRDYYPGVRDYVYPTLPGYSRDGRMALVFFSCPSSFEGPLRYYLLRKVKGRWEIILKGSYSPPGSY